MKNYYIGAGIGNGESFLTSFDAALLKAGMGNYNLVRVSSILPPHCSLRDSITLEQGQILNTAYAALTSDKLDDVISAAVGIGIPKNKDHIGVIMEYSGHCDKEYASAQVHNMIIESMGLRGYEIEDIKCLCVDVKSDGSGFVTVFAGVAMW